MCIRDRWIYIFTLSWPCSDSKLSVLIILCLTFQFWLFGGILKWAISYWFDELASIIYFELGIIERTLRYLIKLNRTECTSYRFDFICANSFSLDNGTDFGSTDFSAHRATIRLGSDLKHIGRRLYSWFPMKQAYLIFLNTRLLLEQLLTARIYLSKSG